MKATKDSVIRRAWYRAKDGSRLVWHVLESFLSDRPHKQITSSTSSPHLCISCSPNVPVRMFQPRQSLPTELKLIISNCVLAYNVKFFGYNVIISLWSVAKSSVNSDHSNPARSLACAVESWWSPRSTSVSSALALCLVSALLTPLRLQRGQGNIPQ